MTTHYTPTPNEFHIGFRYEYMENDKWNSAVCEKNISYWYDRDGEYYKDNVLESDNIFRVKHLDQQDIEELGWDKTKYDNQYEYNSHELIKFEDHICIDNIIYFILNFNELKTLMKILGI